MVDVAGVTLSDVARRAGVSQPSASRVLNGSSRAPSPTIVDAVRRAAAELGYVPNAQAQALARSTTGLLGLVVHDIADPYFSAIAGGVQEAALRHGKLLLLATTQRDPERERAAVSAFVAHRTEATILVGTRLSDPLARAAGASMLVDLGRYTGHGGRLAVVGQPLPGAHVLRPENRAGSAALAAALVAQGHRRFALLSGPAHLETARERLDGFVSGLRRAGLAPVTVVHEDFTRDGGYRAAELVLRSADRPARGQRLCVVAASDVMALGAMAAARAAGLAVPQDLQVAGFDDIPTLQDHWPSVTTVRLPLHDMGERVVDMVFGDGAGQPRTEWVASQVLLGDSTALR